MDFIIGNKFCQLFSLELQAAFILFWDDACQISLSENHSVSIVVLASKSDICRKETGVI